MQQDSHQPQNSISYQNYSNSHTHDKPTAFTIQLNNLQSTYLTTLLPRFYSFQLDTKITVRKQSSQKSIKNEDQIQPKKKNELKTTVPTKLSVNSRQRSNKVAEQIENSVYQKYNVPKDTSRRNSFEGISQPFKPCVKILNLLKSSKTSWAFREPVDTVALGIPHYTEIIKQPMDLSTIQNNLRSNQYVTPTQFHADISKIITNSYIFNSSNIEFTRITAEFESYYRKITSQTIEGLQRIYSQGEVPLVVNSIKSNTDKKIKKEVSKVHELANTSSSIIAMSEKKELGLNIKRLPKEYMKGILDIVNQGKVKSVGEFDLKQLDTVVIRKLQNYVKQKLSLQPKNMHNYSPQAARDNNKQESSFQIDEEDQS